MFGFFNRLIISSRRPPLYWFGLMLFFVFLADSIMGFASPVIIQDALQNTAIMGVVISTSSMVGFVCDMLISRFFPDKKYLFFAKWLLIIALFFPLSFIFLPTHSLSFVIAMAIWGVYFELIAFAQFNFVHQAVEIPEHAHAWGLMEMFQALGVIVGTAIAGLLLASQQLTTLSLAVLSLCIGIVIFKLLEKSGRDNPVQETRPLPHHRHRGYRTITGEFKIWRILIQKVWPLYLFIIALVALDTSFWTIGPLLAEDLSRHHPLGGLLVSITALPVLLTPFYAQRLAVIFGKKRTALVSALIGGIILVVGSLLWSNSLWYLVVVFIGAIFTSLSYPELNATFEDYVARLDNFGNDLVGLRSSAGSMAYVIGPIAAGFLASKLGNGQTIAIFAGVLVVISATMLYIIPRKLRMPKQELVEANK